MMYQLLLVDNEGNAVSAGLRVRMLREFPGPEGVSVHFRPVRNDVLFESARKSGELAYRILRGEGIVRAQLTVEYEVAGAQHSVTGRSSDLLFAVALITAKWKLGATGEHVIAATGILSTNGAVQSVKHTAAKVAAAVASLSQNDKTPASIFYPAADSDAVDAWRRDAQVPAWIELCAVSHLDDVLQILGYSLDKVYLRNPFRGLEHFDYADHAIFFGRDTEVRDVVDLLLRREKAGAPGLLVEGASGSGKSSFLRAGVLPALVEPRFQSQDAQAALRRRRISAGVGRAIWRPGLVVREASEHALAQSIAETWSKFPDFAGAWRDGEVTNLGALAAKRAELWPKALRFVWLIDQFEELLVRGLPDATINAFGGFLDRLQSDGVWTLASIRADAMPLLKLHDALRSVFGANEGQYYLAALGGTALDAVIARPARAADLTFEIDADGKSLDQSLREDAYREKDSLPMLQFTLNELYQKRAGKVLTHAAYRELGGLSGSIATTAGAVLLVEGDSARLAPRIFRSLVSVDEWGNATRRYAPVSEMSEDSAQLRLLQRFIEARLCVADQRGGQAVVAFAHDTLLTTLPALTKWLHQETGLMQTRELVQRETRSWELHEQTDDWLAASDKLAAFETLAAAGVLLPASVQAFIDRSRWRVRRARRIQHTAIGAMALLAVGVVVGAVAFGLQARKAEVAREMTARRGAFLENLLKSADPRGGSKDITVAQLLDGAMRQIDALATSEPLAAASMLQLIAETDNELGHYPEALRIDARALELLRANGGSAVNLSEALTTRGKLLLQVDRFREAEPSLREAVALVEHDKGAAKQLTEALDPLGQSVQYSGHGDEAETIFLREIDVHKRAGHAFGAAEAMPFQYLGELRHDQGRDAQSLVFLREALRISKKYLPPDHPYLLDAEYDYAASLEYNHQAKAAEPTFRELLTSYQRKLGDDHKDTLMAQQGLAHNLLVQQRYAEAAAEALPAAKGLSRVVGDDNSWTQVAWGVYGLAACRSGQGEEGLAVLQRVAGFRKEHFSNTDWHIPSTNVQIGTCLVALKRYAEAEPLLLQAIADLEKSKAKWAGRTEAGYEALRDLCAATGRVDEAAQWQSKMVLASR